MTLLRSARFPAILLLIAAIAGLVIANSPIGAAVIEFSFAHIGIAGTVGYFQSIGYPGFFAYLVILGEIGGGIALILGVQTRAIALLLLPILIGATVQHVGKGWLFNSAGGGWEFPAFWTSMLIVQALLGDGAHALRLGSVPARQAALAH